MDKPLINNPMVKMWVAILFAGIMVSNIFGQKIELKQIQSREAVEPRFVSTSAVAGPVIPGLQQGYIPQGLAYDLSKELMFISHYSEDAPSVVSVVNTVTGKIVASVSLLDANGEPERGHVGGLAVVGDSLIVTSDNRVLRFKLSEFTSKDVAESVAAVSVHSCETKASFGAESPKFLWVGEFALGIKFRTKAGHHMKDRRGVRKLAWVCGYERFESMGAPQCVLSVRQKVQGMCVDGNRIYLSVSYGRTKRSLIVVYRNPIGSEPHKMVELDNGTEVPLWFLDGENYVGELGIPPMSEGIVMIGDRLAVLFESGAGKFQVGGKGAVDRVMLLDVTEFR